jgi:hypothetical protein
VQRVLKAYLNKTLKATEKRRRGRRRGQGRRRGCVVRDNTFIKDVDIKIFTALQTRRLCPLLALLQDDSLARGPKLLSITNYVIEIIT